MWRKRGIYVIQLNNLRLIYKLDKNEFNFKYKIVIDPIPPPFQNSTSPQNTSTKYAQNFKQVGNIIMIYIQ